MNSDSEDDLLNVPDDEDDGWENVSDFTLDNENENNTLLGSGNESDEGVQLRKKNKCG